MDIEQAKIIAEVARVQIVFNEFLNLFAVMIDDTVSYITKEEFAALDTEQFKKNIGNRIIKYVALDNGKDRKIKLH